MTNSKRSSSELHRFSRQVVEIMPLVLKEFIKREDNELSRGKITFPQMVALECVSQNGSVKMTDLARALAIRLSSTTVLVDRLVRDKMFMREHDDKDRRVVWIRLTPKGRRVLSQILEQKRQSIRAIFGPLSAKERGQYLSVLLKVRDRLSRETARK